ncbi:MAG: transcriptional regulator [Rikenellaceae bacterium]|nr:transcriptional regulator [Rikenellaceae bacterium]
MATSADYIEFVMEQLELSGCGLELWCRPMFGEYCIYAGEKPLSFVCDNTVFVKRLPCVADLLADAESGEPYPGAKGWAIVDIEDGRLLKELFTLLYIHKPMPKPKKRRSTCKR